MDAERKLFDEVDALPETKQKRALLDCARTQPLFRDHRNNTVLKGAFGRTQAVRDIEEKAQQIHETGKVISPFFKGRCA